MNTKLGNIVFLAFFVLTGIAILAGSIWAIKTENRLKRFFIGKKAKDLEDTLITLENDIKELKKLKKMQKKKF